jgi:hypothetical protein
VPAPIFGVLAASLLTWWQNSNGLELKAWCFLGLTLSSAYWIMEGLKLSSGHNFGFLAPNLKYYQFNYSTGLVFIGCGITCVAFADSILEFIVSFSLFWFVLSSMFFFVKKQVWKLVYFALIATYALLAFIMIKLNKAEYIFTVIPSLYASLWSLMSEPIIGMTLAVICMLLSLKSFSGAKRRYMQPQEYNNELQPRTWKQHTKQPNTSIMRLFTNESVAFKTWDKIENRVILGLDIGRRNNLLYQGLFGAKVHSGLLKILLLVLAVTSIPALFLLAFGDLHTEATLLPISIFMLFYLVMVSSVVSLEWINNRQSISSLWLFDQSQSRSAYMLKLAMLFAERMGRVSLICVSWFLVFSLVTSGLKGLFVTLCLAVATVTLSLLLQMTYVFFVTLKIKNTSWLRYLTFTFTAANFIGWIVVVVISVQQKNYWILIATIATVLAICAASIKYWCAYDKELAA